MPELLNTTLDDLSAVIGFSATVRLVSHYGGRDLHVPAEVSELHPVAKLIGVSRMRHLVNVWPEERVSVPTLATIRQEIRHATVLRLMLHGIDEHTIAAMTDLGHRRVLQLKREFEREGLLTPSLIPRGKANLENS